MKGFQMESEIDLKCEKCGCSYTKPAVFKEYLTAMKNNVFFKEYLTAMKNNVFFKWSLAFCDKCRREKEAESFKALKH